MSTKAISPPPPAPRGETSPRAPARRDHDRSDPESDERRLAPDVAPAAAAAKSKGTVRRAAVLGTTLGTTLVALRARLAEARSTRNGGQAALSEVGDRIAHLLRRAGFGASPEDLEFYAQLGVEGAVEHLVEYNQVDDRALEQRLAALNLRIYTTIDPPVTATSGDMARWWLLRMVYTRRPLLEKMTLFWHGLLVSELDKVGLANYPNSMMRQNEFFRQNAFGRFPDIIRGISRDPAMVYYLDSAANVKGKAQENYARELLELFTLGIFGPDGITPNYSEQDIREIARAFTGWGLTPATNPPTERFFQYRQNQHDTNPKTVFGQTFNHNSIEDGHRVVDLIMEQPSCRYYLAKRLFEFFAFDGPDVATLHPIVEQFPDVKGMVRAVFRSPAFFADRAYRAKVKAPAEYVAGFCRALRLDTNAAGGGNPSFSFVATTPRMGQQLFNPPDVAGWPGGLDWFTTTTWLERLNVVNYHLRPPDGNTKPVDFAWFIQRFGLDTPEATADYFLGLLVDGQVRESQRRNLVAYLRSGVAWPVPGQPLPASHPAVDRKMRGLVYLIATMPECHYA